MSRRRRQLVSRSALMAALAGVAIAMLAWQPPAPSPQGRPAALAVQSLPDALQHALAADAPALDPLQLDDDLPAVATMEPSVAPSSPHAAQAACLAQVDAAPRSSALRRWQDDQGITHYSDRPPPRGAVTEPITSGHVQTRIDAHGIGVPSGLDQQVQRHVAELETILNGTLGLPERPAARLDITIVAQDKTFVDLVGTPLAASSSGAYIPAQQRVYVRHHDDPDVLDAILRHELAHAMVHRLAGNLPVPLNEGFAAWFQHGGDGPAHRHAGLAVGRALADAAPHDLETAWVDLLASESLHFHRDGREESYLRAHALIGVLMADANGRATLRAILHAQREQPCTPVAAEHIIAAHYGGGLDRLMRRWQLFMNNYQAWMVSAQQGLASTVTLG